MFLNDVSRYTCKHQIIHNIKSDQLYVQRKNIRAHVGANSFTRAGSRARTRLKINHSALCECVYVYTHSRSSRTHRPSVWYQKGPRERATLSAPLCVKPAFHTRESPTATTPPLLSYTRCCAFWLFYAYISRVLTNIDPFCSFSDNQDFCEYGRRVWFFYPSTVGN